MDLLAAWLLYPLVLALLCLGLGLFVGWCAGWRMPGALLLPVGFAAVLTLAQLGTARSDTAELTLALIIALTVVGLVLGRGRLRTLRPDPWLVLAGAAALVAFAAPVLASGTPTFAGYLALPDTGHQLALAELFAHHGPDWFALPDGATREGITPYVISGYPIAAQAALGVTAPLGLLDLAWLYQPLLAFMALMLFLALAAITGQLIEQRWRAALVALVAAQPALVVGYALQGSIKEMACVAVLTTLAALVGALLHDRVGPRGLLVLVPIAPAAVGAIGIAAAGYLAIPGLVVAGVWGLRALREKAWRGLAWIGLAAAATAALSWPGLRLLDTQITVQAGSLDAGASDVVGAEIGNLASPLDLAQALGVWLAGDYRYRTESFGTLQNVELWFVGALALLGLGWAIRRRAWPALLLASVVLPSIYLLHRATPYADAKVLMLASPGVLLLAACGAASLWTGRWRLLAAPVLAALVVAVEVSGALAYHDVSLAPRDRFEELSSLDDRLAGRGPVLLNEYDEFGKYFLSAADPFVEPETNHEYRPDTQSNERRRPSVKTPLDTDELKLDYIERIPYVVLRRGPLGSRPPASFRRVWSGRYYELWQRASAAKVLEHHSLGNSILSPAEPITERLARRMAQRAHRAGGTLAAPLRARPQFFFISRHPRPARWEGFGDYPEGLVSNGPGNIDAPVTLSHSGEYHVWMEGSFSRRLTVSVDSVVVGHTPQVLNNPGAYTSLGTVRLERGLRGVQVRQGGGDARPGNGGYRSSLRHIGPIVFAPVADEADHITRVDPADWRRLVGERADWIEVVKP